MGVKYNREYKDIVNDLVVAIANIPDCHEMFEMEGDVWQSLADQERTEIIRTLSDDLFYGLGLDRRIAVGSGHVEYDPKSHVIKVTGPQVVHIVRLI